MRRIPRKEGDCYKFPVKKENGKMKGCGETFGEFWIPAACAWAPVACGTNGLCPSCAEKLQVRVEKLEEQVGIRQHLAGAKAKKENY